MTTGMDAPHHQFPELRERHYRVGNPKIEPFADDPSASVVLLVGNVHVAPCAKYWPLYLERALERFRGELRRL